MSTTADIESNIYLFILCHFVQLVYYVGKSKLMMLLTIVMLKKIIILQRSFMWLSNMRSFKYGHFLHSIKFSRNQSIGNQSN